MNEIASLTKIAASLFSKRMTLLSFVRFIILHIDP